ncbi:M3 family metallopeptidase [Sphingomonas sp. RIT328]|uniref:M3 family metallopeptidase n=1 Tax=Sphingomonas sp. RIT328 TaxID=1470591 RepID=UPI00069121B8|nr:M3 family metallopeptidase [Sphingomonas sp. RIT328]
MSSEALPLPTRLPVFEALTPATIGPLLDAAIAEQEAVVDALTRDRPTAFGEVWMPLERAAASIEALWSAVYHLHAVVDTPALREAHAAGQERLVEADMRIKQNRELFDLLVDLSRSADFADLPTADRVAVEHALRDFRLAGVSLEPEAKSRYAEVSVELSRLSTEFGSAVLDATDAWSELVADEGLLAGLSPSDRAMLRDAAETQGKSGWLVTLQQPSVAAILTFAEDRRLRARVYEAFGTRASDQGPTAGRFDNSSRIARILELRHQAARLLGFDDPVGLSLATKMADDAGQILAFLRDLASRARPAAEREMDELCGFAARELGIRDLQPWDVGFASERLRRSRYAVDEQAIRAFFPLERVLDGWQTLLRRLFGIRLAERRDVSLWHEDARYFDVADEDGTVVAGLYLDLHARAGKRGGAWMAPARPRLDDGDAVGVPVAYMVCNFAPLSDAAPSLLSHRDVLTLLHETGHCLHHLFTRVDRPSIAGTTGFEWDAVELPSQIMEDFAWDREVLTGMSGHHATGEALPRDLFDGMERARGFQSGMFILRQVEFGIFDLLLHLGTMGNDPVVVVEAVRDEVAVIRPPRWHRFPHSFSHIFAGGYAAGYYSYLWAEVLAADGFQKFSEAGLVDRSVGDAFRAEVLARGASRPASESFRAFRGRDADVHALLTKHGLAAPACDEEPIGSTDII